MDAAMQKLRNVIPSANTLFAFEAAARLQSFTKAAEELHVTHGAVSRRDWSKGVVRVSGRPVGSPVVRRRPSRAASTPSSACPSSI